MSKCIDCVFYRQKEEHYTLGTCRYPMPEYITMQLGGGNFIPYEQGDNECATFKAFSDIAIKGDTE